MCSLRAKVPGHRSELAFGKIGDVPVVAMLGRVCPLFLTTTAEDTDSSQFHAYEGYPLDTVVYPIRLMAALGIQDVISALDLFTDFRPPFDAEKTRLVVTNAAGSLKADVPVGTSAFIPNTMHIIAHPTNLISPILPFFCSFFSFLTTSQKKNVYTPLLSLSILLQSS